MSNVLGIDMNGERIKEYMLLEYTNKKDRDYGLLLSLADDNRKGYAVSLPNSKKMVVKPIKDMEDYCIVNIKPGVPAMLPFDTCFEEKRKFINGMRSGEYHKYIKTDLGRLGGHLDFLTHNFSKSFLSIREEKLSQLFRIVGEKIDPLEFEDIKKEYELDENKEDDIYKKVGQYKYYSQCHRKPGK